MSAQPVDYDDEFDDLLPDDLAPETPSRGAKGKAQPLARTAKQQAAAVARAEAKAEADSLRAAQDAQKAAAARLAQVANLHIAGYSLADIGASIGASADEVDRMLNNDMARYVRNQPALRTFVRNYLSGKYTDLLSAVWDEATDRTHPEKLENQDRALRILNSMGKLHGAEAPLQKEIKVESAPEAVEKLVQALASQTGMGYDDSVFDVIDVEVIEDVVEQTHAALEASSAAVEESDGDDALG